MERFRAEAISWILVLRTLYGTEHVSSQCTLYRVHTAVFLAARAMTPVAVFTAMQLQPFRIRPSGIPRVDRQKHDDGMATL